MSVRLKRLAADYQNISRAFEDHPHVRIVEIEGDPPERYKVEFNLKGLAISDGKVVTKASHLAEVYLPLGYPRQAPQCRMLSPVYHPNIAPHAICIGDHWSAGESLAALIGRIGELITYQSYNVKSPLNGEAARWAEENMDRLPIQRADLSVDVEGGVAPSPSAAAVATSAPEARYPSSLTSVEGGTNFPYDDWLAAVRKELKGVRAFEQLALPMTACISKLKMGRIPEAVSEFDAVRSVAASGSLPQVHFLVAMLQAARKNTDRAVAALENGTQADPTYALAWYYLGVLAQNGGDVDKSRRAYDRYLELNPGSEAARRRREAL